MQDEIADTPTKTLKGVTIPLEVESMDQAIKFIGSFGSYQRNIFVLLTTNFCLGNLCVYPMGFY